MFNEMEICRKISDLLGFEKDAQGVSVFGFVVFSEHKKINSRKKIRSTVYVVDESVEASKDNFSSLFKINIFHEKDEDCAHFGENKIVLATNLHVKVRKWKNEGRLDSLQNCIVFNVSDDDMTYSTHMESSTVTDEVKGRAKLLWNTMMKRNMTAVNSSRFVSVNCQSHAGYKKLADLSPNTSVNVYGYIVSLTEKARTKKGRLHIIIDISDETKWPCLFRVHVFYYERDGHVVLNKGAIIKITSVQVEKFGDCLDGRIFTTKNIVVFDVREEGLLRCFGVPHVITLTDDDRHRVKDLWLKMQILKLPHPHSFLQDKLAQYTKLKDLEPSLTANVFGFVKFVEIMDQSSNEEHRVLLGLMDETCRLNEFYLSIFSKEMVTPVEPGNIVRVHAMKVEELMAGCISSSQDIVVFREEGGLCLPVEANTDVTEFDKYCVQFLWNEFHVATPNSIAQISHPGQYRIKCQILSKHDMHALCHVALVTDGSVHPYIEIEIHNPNHKFRKLEVDEVVVFEYVEVTEVENHSGKSVNFFVDCSKCALDAVDNYFEDSALLKWNSYQQRREKGLLPLEIELKLSQPMFHPINHREDATEVLDDLWDTAFSGLEELLSLSPDNPPDAGSGMLDDSWDAPLLGTKDLMAMTSGRGGGESVTTTNHGGGRNHSVIRRPWGWLFLRCQDTTQAVQSEEIVAVRRQSKAEPSGKHHVGIRGASLVDKLMNDVELNYNVRKEHLSVRGLSEANRSHETLPEGRNSRCGVEIKPHQINILQKERNENEMEVDQKDTVSLGMNYGQDAIKSAENNCDGSQNTFDHLSLELPKYTPLRSVNAASSLSNICAFVAAVQKVETSLHVSYDLSLVDESLVCGEVFHLKLQCSRGQRHPQPEVNHIIRVSQLKVDKESSCCVVECSDQVVLFKVVPDASLDYLTTARIVTITDSDELFVKNLWAKMILKDVSLNDIRSSGFYSFQCQVVSLALDDQNPMLYVSEKSVFRSRQSQRREVCINLRNISDTFRKLKEGEVVYLSRVSVSERICSGEKVLLFQLDCNICELFSSAATFSTGMFTYTHLMQLRPREEPYNIYGFVTSVLKDQESVRDLHCLHLTDQHIFPHEVLQLRLECARPLSCGSSALDKIIRIHHLKVWEEDPFGGIFCGIISNPDHVVIFTVSDCGSINYETSAAFITLTAEDEEHIRNLWNQINNSACSKVCPS